MNVPEAILKFINSHHTANICCVNDGRPYCFTAFYALDAANLYLYIKSSIENTFHGSLLQSHPSVAGTIVGNTDDVSKIQGIQFCGRMHPADDYTPQASAIYHSQFPIAKEVPGDMWVLIPDWIKYTDNTRGFGNKTLWKRKPEPST